MRSATALLAEAAEKLEKDFFPTVGGVPFDDSSDLENHLLGREDLGSWTTRNDSHHTAISVLSAVGVAPELLADLLGHVDTRMVFRHYRHPVTPTIDVAADHIERAMRP